jgi:hypothetical protein
MEGDRAAYDELYAYTMNREGFILQYVVDAYIAQTASRSTKPIGLFFAVVGLYLHVERQFSGVDVQQVHRRLAREKRQWPSVDLPCDRGRLTAADVLAAPPGPARDAAIDEWCRSVWAVYGHTRQTIVKLLRDYEIE